ncbi:TPA: phage tail family protein [Streptococcus equi subsp. zooepidemicus]|nr:phage tail family protein [Streptococcus equi subsp. zooepidemicus]HEL0780556.1 phage tail family protein [Streptococcus equi subsp. zooepidemicus]
MIHDILINNVSVASLGWIRESIDFPSPEPQMETITVPGRNSPIRYTETLGKVSFEPRSFEIVLTMLGDRSKFNQMADALINRFQGKLVTVICSEEPDFYVYGTIVLKREYNPKSGKGEISISCSDADSYRYHVDETSVVITGSGKAILENDYMPVVPKVITTYETVLRWSIGEEQFQKSLSAGTWEIPELELAAGKNTITVSSQGQTTFLYREGRL